MATYSNPINATDIINNYILYYTPATANAGIVYGSNNFPYADASVNLAPYFGGPTSGRPSILTGSSIGGKGAIITAYTIFYATIDEAFKYTMIRKTTFVLNVTGGGGNTGTRPTPGNVIVRTGKSYLNSSYLIGTTTAGFTQGNVVTSQRIIASELDVLFAQITTSWANFYNNNPVTLTNNVCHASCHSSCHGSRSRR
jgi:hypothetical protein